MGKEMRHINKIAVGAAIAVVTIGGAVLNARPALAHEKWFTDPKQYPLQPERAFDPITWVALGLGLLAVATAYIIERIWNGQKHRFHAGERIGISDRRLRALFDYLPLLLAVHVAVPLLVNGIQFSLFVPNNHLPQDIVGATFALGQIVVALGLVYGALTEFVSGLLIALYLGGIVYFGPEAMLEHINLVGIAIFMIIVGRGPFSVDFLLGRVKALNSRALPLAVPALRVTLGLSVVILAFTEKLWNPNLAASFLAFRNLNFLPAFGFQNSDYAFMMLAGMGELVFGLLLISGYLTRLTLAVMWLPFNLTLPFLGWQELVGHLPVYATIVALLVLNPVRVRLRDSLSSYIKSGNWRRMPVRGLTNHSPKHAAS